MSILRDKLRLARRSLAAMRHQLQIAAYRNRNPRSAPRIEALRAQLRAVAVELDALIGVADEDSRNESESSRSDAEPTAGGSFQRGAA